MAGTGEEGTIRKPRGSSLPVALVYPNAYRLGMANLGFQFLYGYLNQHPLLSAERFFFPDYGSGEKWQRGAPRSEESNRPLTDFPVIAFSIAFENDYPAIPGALVAAGIPPLQKDRRASHPLVMAGGVAVSLNPEPLAPFLDLVFIGEVTAEPRGELDELWSLLVEALRMPRVNLDDRTAFVARFSEAQSVYVPSAYHFEFGERGLITAVHPRPGFPSRVRAGKRRSRTAPVPVSVLFSPTAEFGRSLLVETNRGCGRGCRFCAAGWIHMPVRHALFNRFRKDVEDAIRQGRQIGLIGSDLAGHPELESILETIVDQGGTFSLSSIRPEGLSPRVIELLARTGQKTATLAPEVASPRAKKVIGKEIPSEAFYELVEKLVAAGIPNIRFYFMIGIPTETDEDVDQLVDFVLESKKIFVEASRPLGRIGRLGVQINPFIPKPWTPFQWAGMAPRTILEERIRMIRGRLAREPNVVLRVESPRLAAFQAVLSRGDRRLGPAILRIAQQQGRWAGVFKREKIDPSFYALRERGSEEILPWDVIDHGISKQHLRNVYERALASGNEGP
ncbi:MAG: radical SAM protein [Deltaproteobacteria bacterium]